VERFRSIIQQAGFGQCPNHKASIGLTEAEAAAVFLSRESPAIFNVGINVKTSLLERDSNINLGTGKRRITRL
jgi:hypothetical protein